MRRALNLLGALILVLLVLARRGFTELFAEPRESRAQLYPYMRVLIWLWAAASIAFAAIGLWTLATGGYLPVAVLLAFLLGSLVNIARRKRPPQPPT